MNLSRTDLTVETAEELSAGGRLFAPDSGVQLRESLRCGCPVTCIRVASPAGARAIGRPVGRYVTIDLRPCLARQEELTGRAAQCLAGELRALLPLCNMQDVVVDREAKTVYLAQKGMSLDVGAVAKGYAAQLACQEAYQAGFHSFVISAGGNIVTMDPPLDGVRSGWGIGIQDPFTAEELGGGNSIDVAYVNNTCVVTSGDYQRFYMVGDRRIHHIIDPATLMPADYYRGVTVITADSGIADLASTTLYTLPFEQSKEMAARMGWEALWIFADGTVEYTDGIIPLLRDRGGATGLLK